MGTFPSLGHLPSPGPRLPRFVMDTLPADGHIRERDNSCDVIQLNVTGVALDLAILEADSFAVLRRNAKDAGEIGFPGGSCGALVRSEALPSQGEEGLEGPCVFDPNVAEIPPPWQHCCPSSVAPQSPGLLTNAQGSSAVGATGLSDLRWSAATCNMSEEAGCTWRGNYGGQPTRSPHSVIDKRLVPESPLRRSPACA